MTTEKVLDKLKSIWCLLCVFVASLWIFSLMMSSISKNYYEYLYYRSLTQTDKGPDLTEQESDDARTIT